MNRRRALIATGAAAILIGIGIIAYNIVGVMRDGTERPLFDAEWALCDDGDACVAVPAPCGQWEPVNSKHARDAADYYSHLITVVEETEMQCLRASLSTRRPDAYCVSGTCKLGR